MHTTFEIDRMAQNIFNDSLPPSWLTRKQDPDIHIDYFVEISKESKPSGITFGVQLKGTNSPRYSKSQIKISIKTKHLSYYLDKVKQPIFLVVVDVKKKQGFWFFVQKWAKEELTKRNWREQGKVNIKIPIKNRLSDMEGLRAEIARAEIFMRDLWPSSIPAAIQHEKESLEKLDRRIQVDISFHGDRTEYNLQAREPFNFNIQFIKSPSVKDKFTELFKGGKPATFDTDEIIKVEGSDLFESLFVKFGKGKLRIESERNIQAVLLLSTVDVEGQEKIILYGVEGELRIGDKEAWFQGELKETPLKVDFSFPLPPSSGNNPLEINFNFASIGWQGKPVLRLPYFDKLKIFFTSVQEGCSLKTVCEIKGDRIFTATSQPGFDGKFMGWARYFQLFEKIRSIATALNLNLIYPENGGISKDEIECIGLLYELIRCGEYRKSANGVKFSVKLMPTDSFFQMIQNENVQGFSESIIIEPDNNRFTLCGYEFEFYPLRYVLTNPIKIIMNNKDGSMEGIDMQCSGGLESELIVSKI